MNELRNLINELDGVVEQLEESPTTDYNMEQVIDTGLNYITDILSGGEGINISYSLSESNILNVYVYANRFLIGRGTFVIHVAHESVGINISVQDTDGVLTSVVLTDEVIRRMKSAFLKSMNRYS